MILTALKRHRALSQDAEALYLYSKDEVVTSHSHVISVGISVGARTKRQGTNAGSRLIVWPYARNIHNFSVESYRSENFEAQRAWRPKMQTLRGQSV